METNSTENQETPSEERLTLCLVESWQARIEVARADLEVRFREDFARVFEKYRSVADKVHGRRRQRGEPLSDLDAQVLDYMREVDVLVAGVAHDLFFFFAQEATWGESETWVIRRALVEEYLPDVINKTFSEFHPCAMLPGAEVIRDQFCYTCELLIKNSEDWKTLQGVLRERAQAELDRVNDEQVAEDSLAVNPEDSTKAEEAEVSLPSGDVGLGIAEISAERKRLLFEYRTAWRAAGVRVKDEEIAQKANPTTSSHKGWNCRDHIQKWRSCDPKYDGLYDRMIRKVLLQRPSTPSEATHG